MMIQSRVSERTGRTSLALASALVLSSALGGCIRFGVPVSRGSDSWTHVMVAGKARLSCDDPAPARGKLVRLTDASGTVYGEDITGPDGSFIVKAPYRESLLEEGYLSFGDKRLRLPRSPWHSVGSYYAQIVFECHGWKAIGGDAKSEALPELTKSSDTLSTPVSPPSNLLPRRYIEP